MSDLEMKSFGPFEIKSEDRGEVVAVVATLGVVDKDGDVILPGAVPPGGSKVKLSGYNHDVITEGRAPVGKGVITEEDNRLIFRGKFFLSTERGREAFHTTKELGSEGEWSFGFPRNVKTGQLTDDWRTKGAKRMIAGLDAIEASPVFVGAGWGTGTLSTKAADDAGTVLPENVKAAEEGAAEMARLEFGIVADVAAVEIETPADAVAAEAEARIAAEAAEAKATALVAAQLKREMLEEFNRVQRSLQRNGQIALPEIKVA
jgi:hypothetical protein